MSLSSGKVMDGLNSRLVQQAQAALRGTECGEADRRRLVKQLRARVGRLAALDRKYAVVNLSRHIEALHSTAMTA